MLELKDVSKFYYNKGMITSGFTKVNLELKIGEFVAITGESGSGKSTLLNVISGLDSYEEGEMYINGNETSHYTEKNFEDYRRKYIANIFQSFNLVNNTKIINLLVISMLFKELDSPFLNELEQDGFEKILSTFIKNASSDHNSIERLVVHAIKKYTGE